MVRFSRGYPLAVVGVIAGIVAGVAIRQVPGGGLWFGVLLALSAALVAVAQQTLP